MIDWLKVIQLVAQVQAEVQALEAATTDDEKAKAVGELTKTSLALIEVFTQKDLVNDENFAALVADVVKAIHDAENLKPVA